VLVEDKSSGTSIAGATVTIKQTGASLTTNSLGYVDFSLPLGYYTVDVSATGYNSNSQNVNLQGNMSITIYLTAVGGGGGGGGNQPNLEIANYNVSILCPFVGNGHLIDVSGTVLYNGNPLPNVTVYIGFCSAYDPTTHMFSYSIKIKTDGNGNFSSTDLFTQTSPGGVNCVAAVVSYNNVYAYKDMSVTVPWC
jgi:hypothetical protein